jgi:hypothetical protein
VARYNHITQKVVSKFWEGDFDHTDPKVKKAWLFCMMKLIPLVYTKLVKLQGKALWTCVLSAYKCNGDDLELTARSDEAIYWFFEAYFENDWKHNIETDLAKMNSPSCKQEAKQTKRQGCPHASKNMVENYYDWRNKIALKWSDAQE